MSKKYVIHRDEYMSLAGGFEQVSANSIRELLLYLLDVREDSDIDEDDPTMGRVGEMTDEELLKWFHDANGDGQQYVSVWCVDDEKEVLL